MTELQWRKMSNEQREKAYSPSSCLPDGNYRPYIDAYRLQSTSSWAHLDNLGVTTSTLSYGSEPSQTIDIAVPSTSTTPPLLVFLHGGYWQELTKLDSRFAAADCVQRGWAFAAVDYSLAPTVDLPTIVEECRRAIHHLHDAADELGYDPAMIFVAGSSAGAHLAAMVGLDPEGPTPPIRGTVLVSGIYELEPLIGTSINDALALDRPTAAANSPLAAGLSSFPPAFVAYGSNETTEFKAQSEAFAERLRHHRSTDVLEVPDRNHFDVIMDLAATGTLLGDAVGLFIEANRDR